MTPEEIAALAAKQAADAVAATAQTPTPDAPKVKDLDQELFDKLPETAQAYIRHIRGENKEFRGVRNELKEELSAKQKELSEFQTAQKAAEEQKLLEQKKFEELYQNTKSESEKQQRLANQRIIDAELKIKAVQAGIHPKYLKLIDQSGIVVDLASGEVSGIDAKIEKFKTENPELIEAAKQAAAAAAIANTGNGNGNGNTPNPAADMYIPGTQITAKQLESFLNLANTGQIPNPNPSPGGNGKFDAMAIKDKSALAAKLKEITGAR